MKQLSLAVALMLAMVLPAVAQDLPSTSTASNALAQTAQRSDCLAFLQYVFTNELGQKPASGPALCVGESIFITFSVEPWMKSENISQAVISVPGKPDLTFQAKFLWIDDVTGLAIFQAANKGTFKPVTFKADERFGSVAKFSYGVPVTSVGVLENDPARSIYVAGGSTSALLRLPERVVYITGGKLTSECSPVFTANGDAIGMVGSQPFMRYEAASQTGPSDIFLRSGQETSYFHPVQEYADLLAHLAKTPDTPRQVPWIGALSFDGIMPTSPAAAGLGLSGPAVKVDKVIPDQTGAQAGLKDGDVIVAVNAQPVETLPTAQLVARNFLRQLMKMEVGQKVTLTVIRGTARTDVAVPLAKMPQRPVDAPRWIVPPLGLIVREKVMLDQYELTGSAATKPGLLVQQVQPGSPAANAGLKAGDLITAVDNQAVQKLDTFKEQVTKDAQANKAIDLVIERESTTQTVRVEMPTMPTSAPK